MASRSRKWTTTQKTSGHPSWREGLKTMSKKWEVVLQDNIPDICHDVKFLIGEHKTPISCHKLVLAVASPVFQAMFKEDFCKTKEGISTIEIPDVDFNGFQNVLKYAYSGNLDVSVHDALTTMYCGHKYDIPEVVEWCSGVLNSNLSIDNAVTIYQSAVILDAQKLQEKAQEFIVANFQEIMKSSAFLELTEDSLCHFLDLDNILKTATEVDLFTAVVEWGTEQCEKKENKSAKQNLTEVLRNALKCIRFPTMAAKDFTTYVEPLGLLSITDCYNLFKYFSLPEKDRVSINVSYNKKPRGFLSISSSQFQSIAFWDKYMVAQILASSHYNNRAKNSHKETFKITRSKGNKEMRLQAVSLLAPTGSRLNTNSEVEVEMTVYTRDMTYCRDVFKRYRYGSANQHHRRHIPKLQTLGTAIFEGFPTPGEFFDITLDNPIELPTNNACTFEFQFTGGSPVFNHKNVSNENWTCTSADGETSFNVTPVAIPGEGGHDWIIGLMKVMVSVFPTSQANRLDTRERSLSPFNHGFGISHFPPQ